MVVGPIVAELIQNRGHRLECRLEPELPQNSAYGRDSNRLSHYTSVSPGPAFRKPARQFLPAGSTKTGPQQMFLFMRPVAMTK